jgi:hypothetical protein
MNKRAIFSRVFPVFSLLVSGCASDTIATSELVGTWSSAVCEAYPDGNGGTTYLERSFAFTDSTWSLDLDVFGDEGCTVPLFSAAIRGGYAVGAASSTVEGATEATFDFDENVWTAHDPALADLFTASGCGTEPWEVGVAQSVSETGCIGVAHPKDECPIEYDLLMRDGDDLYFGARTTDLCTVDGRPTALAPYAVVAE